MSVKKKLKDFKDWFRENLEPRFKAGDYAIYKETGEYVKVLKYEHFLKGFYIATIEFQNGEGAYVQGEDLKAIPPEQQQLIGL
jgi:hypothetical protein